MESKTDVKKAKIVNEKINTKFKEIKKEPVKEEELEEEVEEDEEDLSVSIRTAPVLQSSNQSQTIEQQVANVPTPRAEERKDRRNYEEFSKVYNMPDYAGSKIYETEEQMQQQRVMAGRIPSPIGEMPVLRQLRQQDFSYPDGRTPRQQEDVVKQYEQKRQQEEPRRSAGRRS